MNIEIKTALEHWLICKKDYKMFRKGECYALSLSENYSADNNTFIIKSRNLRGITVDNFPLDEFFDIFAVSQLSITPKGFIAFENSCTIANDYLKLLTTNALKYEAAMILGGCGDIIAIDSEKKKEYLNDPISKVVDCMSRIYPTGGIHTRFCYVCRVHKINTVGDLLHFQRCNFKDLQNIGKTIMHTLDTALQQMYGIESW